MKLDCQGLVARLIQDFVLLTTAVEVASRWRELADKLARVSKQQMDAYEAPHRDKNGVVETEVRKLSLTVLEQPALTLPRVRQHRNRLFGPSLDSVTRH